MSIESLATQLSELPGFRSRLRSLTLDSVRRQFSSLSTPSDEEAPIDIRYMLTCASILARSDQGDHQDAAFRIAQYALSTASIESAELTAASAFVFETLTNRSAIQLAVERNLVTEAYEHEIPLPLRLDVVAQRVANSLLDSRTNELIALNRFQVALHRKIEDSLWISASAPTSAGKSFILMREVERMLSLHEVNLVVFLVPTRALIQEVQLRFQEYVTSRDISDLEISSVPAAKSYSRAVLVLTQERLHWLMTSDPTFAPDLIVVDEAHKIGDGARGVLLQQVLREAQRRKALRIFFASPMTANPEVLLRGAPDSVNPEHAVVTTQQVSVNQNVLWVSQVPRKSTVWNVELCSSDETISLGQLTLPFRPTATGKRLAFVAHALSGGDGGNLVYVNGAAEAEKAALLLAGFESEINERPDEELITLIDLVKRVVHPMYTLRAALARRVGFHYGNMPLIIKTEIERLFRCGKLRFLVCTSTLLEGVNLPAKSIFLRGPKRGPQPMTEMDFWNLAGRAGRQGKEFQGNVVCVY